jgi:predicted aspartyl protease
MRALLPALLVLLVPGTAAAQPTRIELRNDRIFVPVEIAGHGADALLDSGAEMTLVDSGYAREIGLEGQGGDTLQGSGGHARVTFAEGVTLKVAGKSLTGLTVAILDLSDISRRLNRGVPVRLIVGREFFDSGRWAIDLTAGSLAQADRAGTPAGVRLPLRTVHGIEALPASVEGLPPVLAVFDLGNGSGVMVGKAYAERVGFTRDGRPQRRAAGGGIGGSVDRTMVTLARLDVAGRSFRNIPAAIDEMKSAEDLNIGTSILRHFRITVDYAEHALWLDPID